MEVRCDLELCHWNAGGWCKEKVVSIKNGTCSKLLTSSGLYIDTRYWQNPYFEEPIESEELQ